MAGQTGFYGISEIVEAVCSTFSGRNLPAPSSVLDALTIDEEARCMARRVVPQ
jgi:1-deoxy-D-xylulose-5-phosphate reductoisomerase